MNHDEQLATLTAIVKRLVRETAAMQDRLAKLEKADADTLTGSIDGADCPATLKYKCWACDADDRFPCTDGWIEKRDADTLIGSIDGLEDVTFRVQMQVPPRGRAWAKPEWAEETRTAEPEWSGCSGVD